MLYADFETAEGQLAAYRIVRDFFARLTSGLRANETHRYA